MKQKVIAAILAAQMIATLCPTNTIMAAAIDNATAVESNQESSEDVIEEQQTSETTDKANAADVLDTKETDSSAEKNESEETPEKVDTTESPELVLDITNSDNSVKSQTDDQSLYGSGKETAESDFEWDGNTITKYIGNSTSVVIPSRATAIG